MPSTCTATISPASRRCGWPASRWTSPRRSGSARVLKGGRHIRPGAAIWWRMGEKSGVTQMCPAPTATRVLKKQDAEYLHRHDISSLKALWLAGEPLDEPTAQWISQALGKPI